MKELSCAHCGTPIFLPDEIYQRRLSDGGDFYCSNGHANVFGEPTEKKLQKQIDWLRDRVKNLQEENEYLRHAINGHKGQIAKLKKKIRALEEAQKGTSPE